MKTLSTPPKRIEARGGPYLVLSALLPIAFILLLSTNAATAEPGENDSRARYNADSSISQKLFLTPVDLKGGGRLTVISPTKWSDLNQELVGGLTETHERYRKLFGSLPPVQTEIRLLDDDAFFKATGAPRWTNAMYFRGQIMIPLSNDAPIDLENLKRSIRHEYTHAIINALSSGKCPGWLDEGLAQWAEGAANPILKKSLKRWLKSNPPVPLSMMQGGFTKLDQRIVPAAYAQSFYSTLILVRAYGFDKLAVFLRALGTGVDKSDAFFTAFNVSERAFEEGLKSALTSWSTEQDH